MKRNSKSFRLKMIKEVATRRQRVESCSDPMARYIYEMMTQVTDPNATNLASLLVTILMIKWEVGSVTYGLNDPLKTEWSERLSFAVHFRSGSLFASDHAPPPAYGDNAVDRV